MSLKLNRKQAALFMEYQVWAAAIAKSVMRRLPPSFELADLENVALMAHAKCCREFDTTMGTPYIGYAHVYVQMACLMLVRRKEYIERTHEELPEKLVSEKNLEESVAEQELRQQVQACLAHLPAAERIVIEGVFFEEKSIALLAQELGKSPGTVSKMRNKALDELRRMMELPAIKDQC